MPRLHITKNRTAIMTYLAQGPATTEQLEQFIPTPSLHANLILLQEHGLITSKFSKAKKQTIWSQAKDLDVVPEGKKRGRPAMPTELKGRVRTVRLTDERWEKLRRLGSQWLNNAIDKARPPKGVD